MSLVDEVTAEIKRASTISIVNHFFRHWLGLQGFVIDNISDAELEKLLESIMRITSQVNQEVEGGAE